MECGVSSVECGVSSFQLGQSKARVVVACAVFAVSSSIALRIVLSISSIEGSAAGCGLAICSGSPLNESLSTKFYAGQL